MIATDEETLAGIFTDAIIAIEPRHTYQGAEGWKPYQREKSGADQTRMFRLVWGHPRLFERGAMAGHAIEHEVELRVRTDYVGDHSLTQYTIISDFMQLRDVLSGLKASDNGLVLVEAVDHVARPTYTTADDVTRVDHIYLVRYMRSIEP